MTISDADMKKAGKLIERIRALLGWDVLFLEGETAGSCVAVIIGEKGTVKAFDDQLAEG